MVIPTRSKTSIILHQAKDDKVSIDIYIYSADQYRLLIDSKSANYHDLNMGTYTPVLYRTGIECEINESMTVVKGELKVRWCS
jgi:hypothetical protein